MARSGCNRADQLLAELDVGIRTARLTNAIAEQNKRITIVKPTGSFVIVGFRKDAENHPAGLETVDRPFRAYQHRRIMPGITVHHFAVLRVDDSNKERHKTIVR